jgi:hypothetical protein
MPKPDQPSIQTRLMTGYRLHQAELGMAVLVPGVQMTDPTGRTVAIGQNPLLLSEALCRELASSLLEIADRLRSTSGSV